jgi:uncharacterized membrane protein YqjE
MSAPHEGDLRHESTADLLRQLSQETTTLVKQELQLAKAEMQVKAKEGGKGAGMLGGAGVAALLMLAALTAAAIAALDTAMPLWAAALILALVWGAIAGGMALAGKGRLQEAAPPVPEQTQTSVKEDMAWAKNRAKSGAR